MHDISMHELNRRGTGKQSRQPLRKRLKSIDICMQVLDRLAQAQEKQDLQRSALNQRLEQVGALALSA